MWQIETFDPDTIVSEGHMKTPKDIVKEGYDKVSFAYRGDELEESDESYQQYKAWAEEITVHLKQGSSVLDLGCGCGLPTTKLLARKYKVTGVDISPVQISRARMLVPDAKFICDDMCEVSFDKEQFDAVVSLYAIIHVPVEEQPQLLSRVWQWLKPGGFFLLTAGQTEWTGMEENWLGVDGGHMFWSHADRETYLQWFGTANFTILWDRFIPEANGGHILMLATKDEKS